MRVIEQLINRARTRAAAERLLVKRNVCFSKSFQDGSMKSRVFASPQLHQGTAGIGLFNHLIRFGYIGDERDVAAAAEYCSVWELRIAGRADHDAGKSTTAGIRGVSYCGGAPSTISRTISLARCSSSAVTNKELFPVFSWRTPIWFSRSEAISMSRSDESSPLQISAVVSWGGASERLPSVGGPGMFSSLGGVSVDGSLRKLRLVSERRDGTLRASAARGSESSRSKASLTAASAVSYMENGTPI